MTNEELTAIYNEANGIDPKRHNPITTERIFAAMREAAARERDEIVSLAASRGWAMKNEDSFEDAVREICDMRKRSNANMTGLAPRKDCK